MTSDVNARRENPKFESLSLDPLGLTNFSDRGVSIATPWWVITYCENSRPVNPLQGVPTVF
jgi:hypothetical protein